MFSKTVNRIICICSKMLGEKITSVHCALTSSICGSLSGNYLEGKLMFCSKKNILGFPVCKSQGHHREANI